MQMLSLRICSVLLDQLLFMYEYKYVHVLDINIMYIVWAPVFAPYHSCERRLQIDAANVTGNFISKCLW